MHSGLPRSLLSPVNMGCCFRSSVIWMVWVQVDITFEISGEREMFAHANDSRPVHLSDVS